MTGHTRPRWLAAAAVFAVLVLTLGACSTYAPNTTFGAHSEFGRAIDALTNRLLLLATIVFVVVEGLLIFIIFRFRRTPTNTTARQVHGNTTLEIAWTIVPALILAFIAVPTVRTIFQTQAKAVPNSLQVEVIGHQWWWEFRYPQYGVVTANELYLPVGRTVNFALTTNDVLHSFWIPQLGGKRDLISNHTNYIWFTPDTSFAVNGFCAEYCGASHANMRFKVFTLPPAQFTQWIAHQKTGPAFPVPNTPPPTAPVTTVATSTGFQTPAAEEARPTGPVAPAPTTSVGTWLPDSAPDFVLADTPIPPGLTLANVTGDAARGAQLYKTGACIGCHAVQGVSPGVIGPNLTHVGSRLTIAGGTYRNTPRNMALWVKNSPLMKPGSLMPAFGKSAANPAGYTDQQLADLAAYLQALK